MFDMGPRFRAVFVLLTAPLPALFSPGAANAQDTPPAAAFPESVPAVTNSASTATAPAPSTPPAPTANAAPTPPPAPQGPPPVAYPAPYPYQPPPGYPYGYYPPGLVPIAPVAPPPPRYAKDAAASSTPFFDAILVAADWKNRISESVSVGAQAGVFVARRVRLTAKIAFPTDQAEDFGSGTKNPSIIYAFSAGYAAVSLPTFVMSPGLMLARTDVGDYGTMLGLSVPLDWVMKSGLRLGLEGGLGRAFGGQRVISCNTPGAAECGQQPQYTDREGGSALWLQFQIGFGFNHPGPIPPAAGPPR